MSKSTQATVDQRVKEISELLLDGRTRPFILQYATIWGLSESMIDKYIAQATQMIQAINKIDVHTNIALIASNLWDQFRAAKAILDISECHKILMSIAKLKGLGSETINLNVEDTSEFAAMSDEALEAMILGKSMQ